MTDYCYAQKRSQAGGATLFPRCGISDKKPRSDGNGEEAQTRFELVHTGVADHCLTTWLLRRNEAEASMTRGRIELPLPP